MVSYLAALPAIAAALSVLMADGWVDAALALVLSRDIRPLWLFRRQRVGHQPLPHEAKLSR
jgi:hypothetical protein